MLKIKYEDLFALVEEMTIGAKDKTRTIDKVTNSTVKELIRQESDMAINKGVIESLLATTGIAFSGTMIGTIGGAGTGAVSKGIASLCAKPLMAAGGAATGGISGSWVPVLGPIIGGIVGASVGAFAGSRIKKKNDEKKERLMQEVLKKQNTIIRALEKELNKLKEKYGEAVAQNERYKYIIGVLMANEELKNMC